MGPLLRRWLTRVLLAVALLGLAGGAVAIWPSSPARRALEPEDRPAPTRPLADYLTLPGDRLVVVPNGTYLAGRGRVRAPHPQTDGAYHGWLVLVAESPGKVVVDLAENDLSLGEDTSRIMFVGFRFENGRVRNHGDDIRYWYTTHTFPYDDWVEAGGPDGPHGRPKAMLIGDAERVEIYGARFADIGDDAINLFGSRDVLIEGTTFREIDNDGHGDLIHADAIQVQGDVRRMTVRQSVIERQQIGTEGKGDVARLVWEDCWFRDSRSTGITFAVGERSKITGSRTDIRSFGHRNGTDRADVIEGKRRPSDSARRRIDVTDTRVVTRPPPRDARSPAEEWRADHPYDSWRTLFPPNPGT